MNLNDAERLKLIESTPYSINDSVLYNDLKWLISQARKVEKLKEELKTEIEFHKRDKEGLKDLARSYHAQLLKCKCDK